MAQKIFHDFDLTVFWKDSDYATQEYVCEKPSDQLIVSIEQELGYKLPDSYIELMRFQNGGFPNNTCFPTNESTSWAPDYVAISGILGISRDKANALCGDFGSQFMIDDWGYPQIGVCICDCPSAGHDMIMLDYSKCGNDGEPEVVHIDQESDYRKTFLAKDFETFIRGLVNADVFDTSEEDLQKTLETFKTGNFSTLLEEFIAKETTRDFDKILRNLLTELTKTKGYFSLHADELSWLTYDIQFYLFTKNKIVNSKKEYLDQYEYMLTFGDKEITTGGYAPDFIRDWLDERILKNEISAELKFTLDFENKLLEQLKKYE